MPADITTPTTAADEKAAASSTPSTPTAAAAKPATSIAAEAVRNAIAQVKSETESKGADKGAGATAESTERKETASGEAAGGDEKKPTETAATTTDPPDAKAEEAKTATTDDAPKPYTADEYKTVRNIFDLDPERLPAEFRSLVRRTKGLITDAYQELRKEQKDGGGGRSTAKETEKSDQSSVAAATTQAEANLEEIADELGIPPEGLAKLTAAIEQSLTKKFPELSEQHARAQQEREQEQSNQRSERVANAIALVSKGSKDLDLQAIPEIDDEDHQKAVAKVIESNKRLGYTIATSDDVNVIAGAIADAHAIVKRQQMEAAEAVKPKPKPTPASTETDKAAREKANADEQRGSKAATTGAKVTTTEEGPMTVKRSLREAASRVAAGQF